MRKRRFLRTSLLMMILLAGSARLTNANISAAAEEVVHVTELNTAEDPAEGAAGAGSRESAGDPASISDENSGDTGTNSRETANDPASMSVETSGDAGAGSRESASGTAEITAGETSTEPSADLTTENLAEPTTENLAESSAEETAAAAPAVRSLGLFTTTGYCPCRKCSGGWGRQTSTGATARANHTVAVDPRVIPYGTRLMINGVIYTAEDMGGGVRGKHIDIFFDSHREAQRQGCQKQEVFLVE